MTWDDAERAVAQTEAFVSNLAAGTPSTRVGWFAEGGVRSYLMQTERAARDYARAWSKRGYPMRVVKQTMTTTYEVLPDEPAENGHHRTEHDRA